MGGEMLPMNPMGKHIIERNTTSYNVSYLVDDAKCLCQHEKSHPLTDIKGKWISEIIYIYILRILFNMTHIDTSLHMKIRVYQIRN